MIGTAGADALTPATMARVGNTHQRANSSSGRPPAQLSKIWSTRGAGLHLAEQIGDRGFHQEIDEALEGGGIAIGPEPRFGLILAAAALDHVGGHGPRRPAKADHRDAVRQLRHHAGQSLIDRGKLLFSRRPIEPGQVLAVPQRLEFWPFALDERNLLSERIRDDQNIGEDDCCVEIEPAQGLERYFCGECWIEAKIEEGACLGPDLAIFGEIASRLAHQPDRRRIDGFAA